MKEFFQGFCIGKLTVEIKRHHKTEFLANSRAPPRIIHRRKTVAVDERVNMCQILVPAVRPLVELTAAPARIIGRRATAADCLESFFEKSHEKMVSKPFVASKSPIDRTESIEATEPLDLSMNSTFTEWNAPGEVASSTPKSTTQKENQCPNLLPIPKIPTLNAPKNGADTNFPNLALQPLQFLKYLQDMINKQGEPDEEHSHE